VGNLITAQNELGGGDLRSPPHMDGLPYPRVHLHGPARLHPRHKRAYLPFCSHMALPDWKKPKERRCRRTAAPSLCASSARWSSWPGVAGATSRPPAGSTLRSPPGANLSTEIQRSQGTYWTQAHRSLTRTIQRRERGIIASLLWCAHSDQRARCAGRVDKWWVKRLQLVLTTTLVVRLAFVARAVVEVGIELCGCTRVLAFDG
jgi:hypothetical protein